MTDVVTGIDSLFYSYEKENDVLRAFVTNQSGVIAVNLNESKSVYDTIKNLQEPIRKHDPSRVTLRSIVKEGLEVDTDYNMEARVPLSGDFNEFDLVHLGRNSTSRKTPPEIKTLEDELYKQCLRREGGEHEHKGYKIEELSNPSEEDLSTFMHLMEEAYSRDSELVLWYDLTLENVKEVMETSEVAVARSENQKIVSSVIAKRTVVPTELGNIIKYELTDAATFKEHRRKGLNQKCIKTLLKKVDDADLLYSEARACHAGANQSLTNLGFIFKGRLEKHVRIGGNRHIQGIRGDYEDLNIYYYPIE